MEEFPHSYRVSASARPEDDVQIEGENLPGISSAPPREFGGPGDRWSPETLLMASAADCFVLSFRAVAEASKFEWLDLECETVGTLDRVDRVTRFTRILHRVVLTISEGTRQDRAERLLEKAESVCLISNSLQAEVVLETEVRTR